jgi:hypothetical protein
VRCFESELIFACAAGATVLRGATPLSGIVSLGTCTRPDVRTRVPETGRCRELEEGAIVPATPDCGSWRAVGAALVAGCDDGALGRAAVGVVVSVFLTVSAAVDSVA